MPPCE